MSTRACSRRAFLARSTVTLLGAASPLARAAAEPGSGASGNARPGGGRASIVVGGSQGASSGVMAAALKRAAQELGTADAEFKPMAQPLALLGLRNGSVQSAFLSWANFAQNQEQGVQAVAIAPAWASHASFVVRPDAPYRTVADLAGKRVGSSPRTTGVFSEGAAALAAQGLSIDRDLRLTPMDQSPVLVALFKKGDFDALLVSEPAVSILLASGAARELLQVGAFEASRHGGRYTPVNSWGLRKDWLERQDRDAMVRLFTRASEIARTRKEPFIEAGRASGLDDRTIDLYHERFSKLIVTRFTDENLADAQSLMDQALKDGLIKSAHKVTDFVVRS
jgi:ABC-type nitrate/sulfonate/bicarbonate transport system substrate-binding protein